SGALGTASLVSKMALDYLFNLTGTPPAPFTVGPGNMFDLPKFVDDKGTQVDQNDPQNSLDGQYLGKTSSGTKDTGISDWDVALGIFTGGASLAAEAVAKKVQEYLDNEKTVSGSSGFDTATRNKASTIFATLGFFNAIVRSSVPDPSDTHGIGNTVPLIDAGENAILMA